MHRIWKTLTGTMLVAGVGAMALLPARPVRRRGSVSVRRHGHLGVPLQGHRRDGPASAPPRSPRRPPPSRRHLVRHPPGSPRLTWDLPYFFTVSLFNFLGCLLEGALLFMNISQVSFHQRIEIDQVGIKIWTVHTSKFCCASH